MTIDTITPLADALSTLAELQRMLPDGVRTTTHWEDDELEAIHAQVQQAIDLIEYELGC